jgi:uncharacterized protein (TIGR02231 family)
MEESVKKIIVVVLLTIVAFSLSHAQESEQLPIDSRIEAVTVFSDRAMVKRGFVREFNKGLYRLEIRHLPGALLDESIRVSGEGTAQAKILGVEIKNLYSVQATNQKVKEAEDKFSRLDNQVATLTNRGDVLNRQMNFIIAIGDKTAESINKDLPIARPSVAEWTQMLKFIGTNLDSINNELRQISIDKIKLVEQRQIVANELNKLRSETSRVEKSAFIDLDVAQNGNFAMAISYSISGANWSPLYDIRVNSDKKEAELTYMALISQSTGEDWNDVKVTLSTAKPLAMSAIPKLTPSILDYSAAGQSGGALHARGSRPGEIGFIDDGVILAKDVSTVSRLAPLAIETQLSQQIIAVQAETSVVSNIGVAATFEVIPKTSIISGNQPQKVTMNVLTFKGEMNHFAIPKQSTNVYLKTKLCNESQSPLLAGKANVFYDGDFISATAITSVVPTDSFELFLGVDQAIKVDRELVKKYADEAGFTGDKRKVSYEFKITVENFRKTDENIMILDQYPVSRTKEIEISLKSVVPPVNALPDDESKGFLRWNFSLKPSEKKQMQFKYEIKHPKDSTIEGLF